jgi:hypothetical protein
MQHRTSRLDAQRGRHLGIRRPERRPEQPTRVGTPGVALVGEDVAEPVDEAEARLEGVDLPVHQFAQATGRRARGPADRDPRRDPMDPKRPGARVGPLGLANGPEDRRLRVEVSMRDGNHQGRIGHGQVDHQQRDRGQPGRYAGGPCEDDQAERQGGRSMNEPTQ